MYSLYTHYHTLNVDPPKAALDLLQAILTTKLTPYPSQKFWNKGLIHPNLFQGKIPGMG